MSCCFNYLNKDLLFCEEVFVLLSMDEESRYPEPTNVENIPGQDARQQHSCPQNNEGIILPVVIQLVQPSTRALTKTAQVCEKRFTSTPSNVNIGVKIP